MEKLYIYFQAIFSIESGIRKKIPVDYRINHYQRLLKISLKYGAKHQVSVFSESSGQQILKMGNAQLYRTKRRDIQDMCARHFNHGALSEKIKVPPMSQEDSL